MDCRELVAAAQRRGNRRPMTAAAPLVKNAASSALSLAGRLIEKLPTQPRENTSSLPESVLWILWCGDDVSVSQAAKHQVNKIRGSSLRLIHVYPNGSVNLVILNMFYYFLYDILDVYKQNYS